MYRFLIRLSSFLLILLLPLGAGEVYIRTRPNPSKAKHTFLTAHSRKVDILVLGSSHTYYGVNPELLSPNAYNAAQVSQTYRYDWWILTAYPFDSLRTVILPLSDFSLYESLEDGKEWYLASRYRLYMNCDVHSLLGVYAWEITSFRTYLEKLKQLWQPPRMKWSNRGQGLEYSLALRAENWENASQRAAVNRYDHLENRPSAPYLERIARHCQAEGIRLLLVSTPLRPAYRAAVSPAQEQDMLATGKALQQQYPETVCYLDFRADESFTADDFYDSDHLSLEGSHRFSRLLKAYIDEAEEQKARNG